MAKVLPSLRIETDRLVLRCWEPSDAPLLKLSVDSSLEHLRMWMTWAMQEPSELQRVEERLTGYRERFLEGSDFVYGIFDSSESEVLGTTGLHPRIGPRALEIGYWIRAESINSGFATEATRALTVAAFALREIDRVEIRCDPANAASAAIPRKLGYRNIKTLKGNAQTPLGRPRDTVVFALSAEEYPLHAATAEPNVG